MYNSSMTETKGTYKTRGGKRTPGPGKKLGMRADMGSNPKVYADLLDDETIAALKRVHRYRSRAIRLLAKAFVSK